MAVRQFFQQVKIKARNVIYQRENRPKIPRKKMEIQFSKASKMLDQQMDQLQNFLNDPSHHPSVLRLGNDIFDEISNFKELHLVRINRNRLETVPSSFIHPLDFAVWVLYRMYAYIDEIVQFMKTSKVTQV